MMHCRSTFNRGFTLVETMMAVVILSVMLIVALNTLGASNANQFRTAQRATAAALAQGLLSDILELPYEEPNGSVLFGIEATELRGSKINYDDVDDFNGWSESPPQNRDGSAMSDLQGWTRSVTVQRVSISNPATVVTTESGLKRVTVTISKKGVTLASVAALKASAP
jgi:MSHA pilin protein MshD